MVSSKEYYKKAKENKSDKRRAKLFLMKKKISDETIKNIDNKLVQI